MSTNILATPPSRQRERLQRRARRCRVVFRVGTLLVVFGSVFALLLAMGWQPWPGSSLLGPICVALAAAGAIIGVFAGMWWYATVAQIAKSRDVQNIGYLLEAYATREAVQPAIERALIDTLPLLQTTDAALLTVRQRDHLYQILKVNNARLVTAVLEALQVMGDTRALPIVERLADGHWSAGYNLPVRQAAETCQEALRERAEYEQHSKGLLRASEAPRASAEVLLRPAASTITREGELLRAVNRADSEQGSHG